MIQSRDVGSTRKCLTGFNESSKVGTLESV